MVKDHGALFGEKLFNYLYPDLGTTWEQVATHRQELAEAVFKVFEQGSREEKAGAVKALLEVIETKTGQVGRMAQDALHWVTPIG